MRSDTRPPRHGWAPGDYLGRCHGAGCNDKSHEDALFIGDKRATMFNGQADPDEVFSKVMVAFCRNLQQ